MLSLFAGAGGLDIGLERAGFTTLAINELEPHACESLRQNKCLSLLKPSDFDAWFAERLSQRCYENADAKSIQRLRDRLKSAVGKYKFLSQATIIEGDVRLVSSRQLADAAGIEPGQLTLVAGGPPCQPFSRAGKRETVEADDGRLFLEFVRIVRDTRPRWFLFENVKGLMQSKTLVPYLACKHCGSETVTAFELRQKLLAKVIAAGPCPKCGSQATVDLKEVRGGSLEIILNEFTRAGYLCYSKLLNAADFGVPQSRERLFIVGSRDHESFEWPEATHGAVEEYSGQSQLVLDGLAPNLLPRRTVKDILWKDGHQDYGVLDMNMAVLWVKNVVRPHDEPVCWTLDRPSPTIGAHQAAKLALAPKGVPPEQLFRQQWHTLGRRMKDTPPVFVEHEYLTDEELLLLQTFPADWYLHGTRMQRAFQIGNAVPPDLAAAVGRSILAACKAKTNSKKQSKAVELM